MTIEIKALLDRAYSLSDDAYNVLIKLKNIKNKSKEDKFNIEKLDRFINYIDDALNVLS